MPIHNFTVDPDKKGMKKLLGDLESDIMEIVWVGKTVSVRDVYTELNKTRDLAYTTVMTVMSRLAVKGILERVKDSNSFLYKPVYSREDFTSFSVRRVVTELMENFSAPAISHFLDSIEEENPEKIDELIKLIEEKRKLRDNA